MRDKEHDLRTQDVLDLLKKSHILIARETLDQWVREGKFPKSTRSNGKEPVWTMKQFKDWSLEYVVKVK